MLFPSVSLNNNTSCVFQKLLTPFIRFVTEKYQLSINDLKYINVNVFFLNLACFSRVPSVVLIVSAQ